MRRSRHVHALSRGLVSLGLASLVLSASPAFVCADAIGLSSACPPGTRGVARHSGSWCRAAECEDACADFDDLPAHCESRRVCTEVRSVFAGSPAASSVFGDPGMEEVEMVVETCAAGEACDGTGDRAPTAGALREGSRHCSLRDVCVPDALPSFASRLEPAPEAEPSPAPSVAPTPATGSGCGCRAVPRSTSGLALLSMATIVLALRRRQR